MQHARRVNGLVQTHFSPVSGPNGIWGGQLNTMRHPSTCRRLYCLWVEIVRVFRARTCV